MPQIFPSRDGRNATTTRSAPIRRSTARWKKRRAPRSNSQLLYLFVLSKSLQLEVIARARTERDLERCFHSDGRSIFRRGIELPLSQSLCSELIEEIGRASCRERV